jgi:hypothetical protein
MYTYILPVKFDERPKWWKNCHDELAEWNYQQITSWQGNWVDTWNRKFPHKARTLPHRTGIAIDFNSEQDYTLFVLRYS